jgi:adenylylsulfate kinase
MEDRTENIRRIAEVAHLFNDAGVIVITAFISPYRADRDAARAVINGGAVQDVENVKQVKIGGDSAASTSPSGRLNDLNEGSARFIEVFVDTPIEVCEQRDPKGLYKKARAGEIPQFTGITDPYEAPEKPELVLPTAELSAEQSVDHIIAKLRESGVIG